MRVIRAFQGARKEESLKTQRFLFWLDTYFISMIN